MSYQLTGMFSPDFFGDIFENQPVTVPTNIADAIASISPYMRQQIAINVFGLLNDNFLSDEMIFDKIVDTDTVRDLISPVEVYIDKEGWYSVFVYDMKGVK